MKRGFCALLAAIMLLLITDVPSNVYAVDTDSCNLSQTVYAELDDGAGNVEVVSGRLVDSGAVHSSSKIDGAIATYAFDLYAADNTLTTKDSDGAAASTVYLTIEYKTKNTPTEYLLTRVSGYWKIHVSNVQVTQAYLNYGCNGSFPQIVQNQYVNDRSVNNNFSYTTGFTKYVADVIGSAVGANLRLTYKMGTSRTWSFRLYNNIVTP